MICFRQGGIYNCSVLGAQIKVATSFIFRDLDLSLANYADDILNLGRTYCCFRRELLILKVMIIRRMALGLTQKKSEIVVVVEKSIARYSAENIRLGSHLLKLSPIVLLALDC